MNGMTDMLQEILNLGERALASDLGSRLMMGVFAALLIFGVLNCVLGYRLLRFWMMLGGFFTGAALAFVIMHGMGSFQNSAYLIAMLITGVIFAVIAFLIYKAGVFILAAGIGWTLSIYFIHPTTSAIFFACVLIGVALGSLAVKYCREVLIVATSLIGGVMAGVSLAQLGHLDNIPYGVGMSLGFGVLGILIQFAINKPQVEQEVEEEMIEVAEQDDYAEIRKAQTGKAKPEDVQMGKAKPDMQRRKSARPDRPYSRYNPNGTVDRHTRHFKETEDEEEK